MKVTVEEHKEIENDEVIIYCSKEDERAKIYRTIIFQSYKKYYSKHKVYRKNCANAKQELGSNPS